MNNKKNVGVLTFHYAHNYGAVLQAWALKECLNRLGFEAEIINYRNKTIQANYMRDNKFDDKYRQRQWERQFERFEKFINSHMLNDIGVVNYEELSGLNYYAFICGSDQIWNSGLTGGLDDAYFLKFDTNAKKISYAPSKFKSWIKPEEVSYWQKALSDFAAISVRERVLAENVSRALNLDVFSVLDPCLLLEKTDYEDLYYRKNPYGDYVLAYYNGEDELLHGCACALAKRHGLKVVEIHFFAIDASDSIQLADCGPLEFLQLIRDAAFVLTNSFHGTAFSIIYEKIFWSIYDADMRKDDLLDKLGLSSRHIRNSHEFDGSSEAIDYIMVNKIIKEERLKSIKFLETALREDGNG